MASSGISAGDVNEDGRVLRYENGECESPAFYYSVMKLESYVKR